MPNPIGPACDHCGRHAHELAELASWVTIQTGAPPWVLDPDRYFACSTDCGVEIVNRVTDGR